MRTDTNAPRRVGVEIEGGIEEVGIEGTCCYASVNIFTLIYEYNCNDENDDGDDDDDDDDDEDDDGDVLCSMGCKKEMFLLEEGRGGWSA